MNTRKTVYEKLFRNEETKLATHEIELGLIQELEASSKTNIDLAAKLDTEFTKFAEIRSIIKSDLARLTTQNKDVSDRINKAITAAKELGVESPDLFKYNRYTQDINSLIKDVTAKLNR